LDGFDMLGNALTLETYDPIVVLRK